MNATRLAYWTATILFSAFMAFDIYSLFSHDPKMTAAFVSLGYPTYLMPILGTAEALGIVAILAPGAVRLKEWAYAGFTFTFMGAFFSHMASGQQKEAALPLVALIVMAISYLLRPHQRRILEAAAAVR